MPTAPEPDQPRAAFLKPGLRDLMERLGLDVMFERGAGDHLFYRNATGEDVAVLDLVGGYGASLFGHNHPELAATAKSVLDSGRPFHAQASVRPLAEELAGRLARMTSQAVGGDYVVTLANTGAEAVEAAIKHAEWERTRRWNGLCCAAEGTALRMRIRLSCGEQVDVDGLRRQARELLGLDGVPSVAVILDTIHQRNRLAADAPPLLWAMEGAFHGMTLGALGLTFHEEYRRPWRHVVPACRFLPMDNPAAVAAAFDDDSVDYFELELSDDGEVRLARRRFCNVAACFVEPIQGEGGIREIPGEMVGRLRQAAHTGGFPLVFDEIQCGLGRTGSWLASEVYGCRADCYLLSKSLGGGLAKIAAMLVDRSRYVADFGTLHASTFADDDYSCAVALRALDLLERDDAALVRGCAERGARLLGVLRTLQGMFPDQIAEVRGRGLMIGLELAPQNQAYSSLLRLASEQRLLGFLVARFLLAKENIRVLPTLSSPMTLRFEPSAYIPHEEILRTRDALARVFSLIQEERTEPLCRALLSVHDAPMGNDQTVTERRLVPRRQSGRSASVVDKLPRVALISHFLEPADFRDWDPTLADLTDDECSRLLGSLSKIVKPFIAGEQTVQSAGGEAIRLTVVGLALTAEQALAARRDPVKDWAKDYIRDAVEFSKSLGACVAGLGGYTSILTDAGRDIVENDIVITTGNSLTAAAALTAIDKARRRLGIHRPRLAVVGAAGNIGAVLAEVASRSIGELVLVGRPGSKNRLEEAARNLYQKALDSVASGHDEGLAGVILASPRFDLRGLSLSSLTGGQREAIVDHLFANGPVEIATDLESLASCNLIVTATNSPRFVVRPQHIGHEPCVICDVSAPPNIDPGIREARPQALLLRGGLVQLPAGQSITIPGVPLPRGEIYGCMAEAMLIALAGRRERLSYGPLSAAGVRRAAEMAETFGFSINECPL